jgi:hypothetical protein
MSIAPSHSDREDHITSSRVEEPQVPPTVFVTEEPIYVPPPVVAGPESPQKGFGIPRFQPAVMPLENTYSSLEEPVPEITVAAPTIISDRQSSRAAPTIDRQSSVAVDDDFQSLPQSQASPHIPNGTITPKRSNASLAAKSVAESDTESLGSERPGPVSHKASQSSIGSSYQWSARAAPNSRYKSTASVQYVLSLTSAVFDAYQPTSGDEDPFSDPPVKHTVITPAESVQIPE